MCMVCVCVCVPDFGVLAGVSYTHSSATRMSCQASGKAFMEAMRPLKTPVFEAVKTTVEQLGMVSLRCDALAHSCVCLLGAGWLLV